MVIKKYIIPNYDEVAIKVEFLVIHYSAMSLQGVLDIFADKDSKVSSHFIISEEGGIFETVPCSGDVVCRAWHAGESVWEDGRSWSSFNNISIGIELINLNGNVFNYTQQQVRALKELIHHLKNKHDKLRDARRIVGHEQIAGYRGKVDPGICFDWKDIYQSCYGNLPYPERKHVLPVHIAGTLRRYLHENNLIRNQDDLFWQQLNTSIENTIKSKSGNLEEFVWLQ